MAAGFVLSLYLLFPRTAARIGLIAAVVLATATLAATVLIVIGLPWLMSLLGAARWFYFFVFNGYEANVTESHRLERLVLILQEVPDDVDRTCCGDPHGVHH